MAKLTVANLEKRCRMGGHGGQSLDRQSIEKLVQRLAEAVGETATRQRDR